MHPLLDLLVAQPALLADHALAYVELTAQEAAQYSRVFKRRILLTVCAVCCATLACALAGVAFMLWFVSPLAQSSFPWPLVITPLLPLVALLWCLMKLKAVAGETGFDRVQQQLLADKALLSEMCRA